MTENKMIEVCKLVGVGLGESFKLNITDSDIYHIEEKGLEAKIGGVWRKADGLEKILAGEIEVIKLPYHPGSGDAYYMVDGRETEGRNRVVRRIWMGISLDYMNYILGNCFRTRQEAEKSNVFKKLSKTYLNGAPLDYQEDTL